jgi:hypothetical protein
LVNDPPWIRKRSERTQPSRESIGWLHTHACSCFRRQALVTTRINAVATFLRRERVRLDRIAPCLLRNARLCPLTPTQSPPAHSESQCLAHRHPPPRHRRRWTHAHQSRIHPSLRLLCLPCLRAVGAMAAEIARRRPFPFWALPCPLVVEAGQCLCVRPSRSRIPFASSALLLSPFRLVCFRSCPLQSAFLFSFSLCLSHAAAAMATRGDIHWTPHYDTAYQHFHGYSERNLASVPRLPACSRLHPKEDGGFLSLLAPCTV